MNVLDENRTHLYFALAIVAVVATGGFAMIEIANTMTEFAMIEGTFYNAVRNGEARLSSEINRSIEDIDLNGLEKEIEEIDTEINSL